MSKNLDKELAYQLLGAARRKLAKLDLCKKLAKATNKQTPQYKGLLRRIMLCNREARDCIRVARMLAKLS